MNRTAQIQAVLVVLVLLSLPGCNSAAMTMNDLKQAGLAYHTFHDDHKQGPKDWNDLMSAGLDAKTADRLRAAGYEFKWGVKFAELKESSATTVLAESKTGTYKLMMDGSVTQ